MKYCFWVFLRYDELNQSCHYCWCAWNLAPFVTVGHLSQYSHSRRFFFLLLKLPSCGNFFFGVSFFACTRWAWNFQWFFGRAWYFHHQKRHPEASLKKSHFWILGLANFTPSCFWYFFSYHFFFKNHFKNGPNKKVVVEFQENTPLVIFKFGRWWFFKKSSKAPELYRKKTRVEPKFCETINSCLNWFPQ